MSLPRYDISQSYQWNFDHAPDPIQVAERPVTGRWQLCGRSLNSPLGIAAGPLLNGRWILYYASLGFDVLTYKTVRRCQRNCYPLPNLLPVHAATMTGNEQQLFDQSEMHESWAISFGMPSQPPDVWRADIRQTRDRLDAAKLLAVSVVATVEPNWSIQQVAEDYALCALWAVEAGADLIEINLSCPNVATCDGQLYQQPHDAGVVASTVKRAIGKTPLLAKIGHVATNDAAFQLLGEVSPYLDAFIMVNGLATRVLGGDGQPRFDGQKRGIGGRAIRDVSLAQISRFQSLIEQHRFDVQLIGCGGIFDAKDVRAMMACGASAVQLATAAMLNPAVATEIRRDLNSEVHAADD